MIKKNDPPANYFPQKKITMEVLRSLETYFFLLPLHLFQHMTKYTDLVPKCRIKGCKCHYCQSVKSERFSYFQIRAEFGLSNISLHLRYIVILFQIEDFSDLVHLYFTDGNKLRSLIKQTFFTKMDEIRYGNVFIEFRNNKIFVAVKTEQDKYVTHDISLECPCLRREIGNALYELHESEGKCTIS